MIQSASDHYDDIYFQRQNASEDIRSTVTSHMFRNFIPCGARILDFGCGGGGLLRALGGGTGVEINPAAASHAREKGLEVVSSLKDLPGDAFGAVISNHALEHTENPIAELREMARVCKRGGVIIIVTPCDRPSFGFRHDDPDFHLFSWSANNLGNAVKLAGFEILSAKEIKHNFPPRWEFVARRLGFRIFNLLSWARGHLYPPRSQVRVIGKRL